jgi:hypothetical protein
MTEEQYREKLAAIIQFQHRGSGAQCNPCRYRRGLANGLQKDFVRASTEAPQPLASQHHSGESHPRRGPERDPMNPWPTAVLRGARQGWLCLCSSPGVVEKR